MAELLLGPASGTEDHSFALRPRPKSAFRSVLPAAAMIDPAGCIARVRTEVGDEVSVRLDFPLRQGTIQQSLVLGRVGDRLRSQSFTRLVFGADEDCVRREEVSFGSAAIPLPEAVYPEIMLPFLLRWQPFDGEGRELFAWINDRFTARVEYRSKGLTRLTSEGGMRAAVKVVMYPDFNDWVRLGKVLTRLVHPFLPKYHMWYEPEPPHALLRFEGPFGPPGAPELLLERRAAQ